MQRCSGNKPTASFFIYGKIYGRKQMIKEGLIMKDEVDFPLDKEMLEDERSKRVIFVCHCLLNANSKVLEGARYKGMYKEVVQTLQKYDLGVVQLSCPEMLHFGCNRYWGGKNVFDSAGYRRFCREQAELTLDYIENYQKIGYEIVCILGCDGSPTCGVNYTNHYSNGGGRPKDVQRSLLKEKGIFMEEIEKEVEKRRLQMPDMYGLGMDICSKSMEEVFEDFQRYLEKRI